VICGDNRDEVDAEKGQGNDVLGHARQQSAQRQRGLTATKSPLGAAQSLSREAY